MLIQHLFSKPRTHVMSSLFYAVLEKWWKIRGQIPVKLPITTNGRVHFFFSFFFCCQLSLPAQKHEFYNPQCNESSMSAWILLFSPRAPARLCWYSSHVSCWCCSFEVCVCAYIYVCICVSVFLFIVEVLQMKASCLPSGITATQEVNNQLPLACVASNSFPNDHLQVSTAAVFPPLPIYNVNTLQQLHMCVWDGLQQAKAHQKILTPVC